MTRWLAAPLLVALAIAAAATRPHAQVRPTAPLAGTPPRPRSALAGVVVGQVIDATTGRGVPKATVRLTGRGVRDACLTDEIGQFYFAVRSPGDFTLTAEKTGFFSGAHARLRPAGDSVPLTVYSGDWIANLRIPVFRPSILAGFVTDESSEPLAGVRVTALRREVIAGRWQLAFGGEDTTDDLGRYRVSGLPPGDYVVAVPSLHAAVPRDVLLGESASADLSNLLSITSSITSGSEIGAALDATVVFDAEARTALVLGRSAMPPPRTGAPFYAYPTDYHPGGDLASLAQPMTLAVGEVRDAVNFSLRPVPTARVSGAVVGPDGPVPRQLLRLFPSDAPDPGAGRETAVTMSDAAGRFTFLDVPPGRYTLSARSAAALTPLGNPLSPTAARWASMTVVVPPDDVSSVLVTMQDGLAVSGNVVIASPSERASEIAAATEIVAEPADGSAGPLPVAAGSDGQFRIAGLVAGRYFIRVRASAAGWVLKSAMADGVDVSEAPLEIESDRQVPAVSVTLTDRPVRIIGTIRDTRGFPAPTATVVVFPAGFRTLTDYGRTPRRLRSARTTAHGIYTLAGLPPGDYLFAVIDEASSGGWQDPLVLERLAPAATRVTLREAEERTIDLRYVGTRR